MKKIDELLQRVEVFERLAVYGDRKNFLKALAQEYSPNPNMSAPGSENEPNQSIDTTPKDSGGVVNIPAGDEIKAYPPIDKNIQKMLNDLLVPSGDIFLLQEDGKLGKHTKDALKKFEAKFGKPGTPQAIAQVWNSTKNQVAKSEPSGTVAPIKVEGPNLNTKSTISDSAGEPRDVGNPRI